MRTSTRIRLFLAQLILMFSWLFLGAIVIHHDHHWPTYLYLVDAAVMTALGFLIPTRVESYRRLPPKNNDWFQ